MTDHLHVHPPLDPFPPDDRAWLRRGYIEVAPGQWFPREPGKVKLVCVLPGRSGYSRPADTTEKGMRFWGFSDGAGASKPNCPAWADPAVYAEAYEAGKTARARAFAAEVGKP